MSILLTRFHGTVSLHEFLGVLSFTGEKLIYLNALLGETYSRGIFWILASEKEDTSPPWAPLITELSVGFSGGIRAFVLVP